MGFWHESMIFMITARIPKITKQWLVVILVLALLPCFGMATDTAALNEPHIDARVGGHLPSVETLLDSGTDVNAKNYWGNSALTIGSNKGHTQIADPLKGRRDMSIKWVMIVGTIKLIAVLVILVLIARSRKQHPLDNSFFESQKWTLNDAYKILAPLLVVAYLQFILHHTLPHYAIPALSLISGLISSTAIYGCYYLFIRKPYGVDHTIFGLDKAKFLKSGVRNANIALMFLLLMAFVIKVPAVPGRTIDELMRPLFAAYVLTVILAVSVGPVLEEVLFRGILYPPVARRIGTWKAMALLSVTAALVHLPFTGAASLGHVVISFLLYYGYVKSGSLYGPIIWHITLNLYVTCSDLAKLLAPYIEITTLGKCYFCGLLLCLVTINAFWLAAFFRRRRLQDEITADFRGHHP